MTRRSILASLFGRAMPHKDNRGAVAAAILASIEGQPELWRGDRYHFGNGIYTLWIENAPYGDMRLESPVGIEFDRSTARRLRDAMHQWAIWKGTQANEVRTTHHGTQGFVKSELTVMASGLHVWCQVENADPISKLPLDGLVWFHTPSAGIFLLCTVSGEPVKQTSLPKIVFGKEPK